MRNLTKEQIEKAFETSGEYIPSDTKSWIEKVRFVKISESGKAVYKIFYITEGEIDSSLAYISVKDHDFYGEF